MTKPVALADLATALNLGSHSLVSLVGGGGKSTTMFALAESLEGNRIVTTTTKMGSDQTAGMATLVDPSDEALSAALVTSPSLVVWRAIDGTKALGVTPQQCDRWFDLANHVLVEADGSRRHPFKAPRPFEPVIPSRTTVLIACIGVSALGRVIADQCQRPLRVAAVAECSPFERLTPERAARVLVSPRGSAKGQPAGARLVVAICAVDDTTIVQAGELESALAPEIEVILIAQREYTQQEDS